MDRGGLRPGPGLPIILTSVLHPAHTRTSSSLALCHIRLRLLLCMATDAHKSAPYMTFSLRSMRTQHNAWVDSRSWMLG